MEHARSSLRKIRHRRIRARVQGTAERPRLSVFRSARHIAVQLIDDQASRTLLSVSDLELPSAGLKGSADATRGVVRAFAVGKLLAERARAQGIQRVVFDRSGYAYHGQVKAVAEGARAGGVDV